MPHRPKWWAMSTICCRQKKNSEVVVALAYLARKRQPRGLAPTPGHHRAVTHCDACDTLAL